MPEVSRFFGIIISLNYNEHPPPHFHVRYNDQKALVDIESLRLLEGHLSPRALGMVIEWASRYQVDLRVNWSLARQMKPLKKIPPLE
ncbi:MAG: DUF4160 domain-containing protein [Caldilineaceae bacterium]|jgi:hypothetical protein